MTQTRLKYNDVVKRNDGDLVSLEIQKGLPHEALTELRYFDFLGNLVSREQVSKDGSITEYYTYDIGGRMTEYTDPLGNRVQNAYDVFGNVVRTKNQTGEITTYSYNLRSQMTGESNGAGYHKYYGYDELGRVVRTREVNAKDILSCRLSKNYYDGNGNLIKAVNALNEETVFKYDELNRLVMQKTGNDKDGILARFKYNELDKIIESAYGAKNPNITRYEYDRFGRQTRTIDALGNISYYKYDITGNLTEKTDRNGVVTRLDYDGLGRLVYEVNSKDKTPSVFTYDSNSLMKTAKDATGTYGFSYDGLGRLYNITNPDNLEQIYTYDAGSNIKTYEQVRIGTVEHRLTNHYDGLGRLTAVETPAGVVKYEYDDIGRLTREENLGADVNRVRLGDGSFVLIYSFKAADSMTEYSYDEYNNISGINEWINGKKYEKSFNYDRNNRLVFSRDYEKSARVWTRGLSICLEKID